MSLGRLHALPLALVVAMAYLSTPARADDFPVWAFPVVIVGGVAIIALGVVALMYCSNSCDDVDLATVERTDSMGYPKSSYPQVTNSRRGTMSRSSSRSSMDSRDSSYESSRSIGSQSSRSFDSQSSRSASRRISNRSFDSRDSSRYH